MACDRLEMSDGYSDGSYGSAYGDVYEQEGWLERKFESVIALILLLITVVLGIGVLYFIVRTCGDLNGCEGKDGGYSVPKESFLTTQFYLLIMLISVALLVITVVGVFFYIIRYNERDMYGNCPVQKSWTQKHFKPIMGILSIVLLIVAFVGIVAFIIRSIDDLD